MAIKFKKLENTCSLFTQKPLFENALSVWRFMSSDTLVEAVVLPVRVVDSDSGVVELGTTPLVVPQFYGLSNTIDSSVLNIRTTADMFCTVRLMTTDTSVPALGQLVLEEDSKQRKGMKFPCDSEFLNCTDCILMG